MMAVVEVISNLKDQLSERQEQYTCVVKSLSENADTACEGLNSENLKTLCDTIFEDLKNEASESPQAVKCLQCLLQNKHLQKTFTDAEKIEVIKNLISSIDSSLNENVLVNYFSVLIQISSSFNLDTGMLNSLLLKMDDVLSKKSAISAYFLICNYFQKFLKDYEGKLSNFVPVLSKLVFVPLCHPSTKVREVAEKTLDMFPKLLLYTPDDEVTSSLLKLVKESYSKDLLLLFRDKQELYVLKVWKHVVNALGNALPANLPAITPFFQVIEKGFKSPTDEVCIASFAAWKHLINCFANAEGVLNDSKKLRFILKPFKNISRSSENILINACDAWWFLAWNLAENLSSRFTEVCIPLIELTVGKITNGHPEKIPKGPLSLLKKCCYILLRFLEQPPSDAINRISSPKKLPHVPYPVLQSPLELKIITHHFKEILYAFRIVIDVGGARDDMTNYLECIMKSVLYIVSTLIEDSNKESVEAVTAYLNFITDVIEAKVYPSILCLKCIESLSKFSRKLLVSHHFNCGPRTSQDVLCISLLKLLLNNHVFPSESPKRFSVTYNRLVQAGMQESFHPLLITQKFMHVIRMAIGTNSVDMEALIDVWSGIATPLLEIIEKTQEVNQGDKQEHDFSCMYDVLIFPFEYIFPVYLQQFRTRPAFKLWTTLYKAFIRCAALVSTTTTNESNEIFCLKLGACLKEESIKKLHFFESVCLFMQIIIESFDFSSGNSSGPQGIMDVALMVKRKKPLRNFTSFVDILSLLLKTYHSHFIEEEASDQENTSANQRKLQILKNAAPLDLVKSFFGSIKSGGIISFALEQLSDPLSKLFLQSSQKRNLVNHIDAKLEIMWNVITSTIERYYLGPYDSDFLAIMSPLLETTFSHPKRHVKEKSRRFWFATFGPNASSLKFPDSLKNVLKKMNLLLPPDGLISPTEFSISPLTDSIPDSVPEACLGVEPPVVLQSNLSKALPVKNTPVVNGEASKMVTKESKPTSKISIDDLPSQEFVKIDSSVVPSAYKRRSIRKKKSYVPTLYNDLSQDLSNMASSLDSQDTFSNSTSLGDPEFKVPLVENKETSEKEPVPVAMNQKDIPSSKTLPKSSMATTFQESLDKSLRDAEVINVDSEVISIESSGSDCEDNDKSTRKSKLDSEQNLVKSENELNEKMSVFSMPGDKRAQSRSTRRNARLSQSFSGTSDKKNSQNKLEFQKLNKSCIELINLSDSEEIIPSSQSSTDNETSIKVSTSRNTSPNPEEFKKLSPDDLNGTVIQSSITLASPEKDGTEKSFEEFIDENVESNRKLTSTPAKSKIQGNNDDGCEKPVDVKSSKEISNDASKLASDCARNCDELIQPLDKEINDKLADSPKSIESDCPIDVQSNNKDDIKDINFLLDAVDDLQKAKQSADDVSKDFEYSQDKNMKEVPLIEIKNTTGSSIPKDKKSSSLAPVRKTRLSIRITKTNPGQDVDYSQKLRKKAVTVESNQQMKSRKRKSLKEIPTDSQKKAVIEDGKGDIIVCDKKTNIADNSEDTAFSDCKTKEKSILDESLMLDKSKEKSDELSENKTSHNIEVSNSDTANGDSSETVLENRKYGETLNRLDNCKEKDHSVYDKDDANLFSKDLDVVILSQTIKEVNKLDSLKNESRRKSLRKSLLQPSKSEENNQEFCFAERSSSSGLDPHAVEESGKSSSSHEIPSKSNAALKRRKSNRDIPDESNNPKKKAKDQPETSNDILQPLKYELVKNADLEVEMLEKANIDQEIQPETQMNMEEGNCDIVMWDEIKRSNKETEDLLETNEAGVSSQENEGVNNLTQGEKIQSKLHNDKSKEISDLLHCTENAESCDIFDLCSENSCKEFPDSKNIARNIVSLSEIASVAEMKETQCPSSPQNEDKSLMPIALEENKKVADVITAGIIPSSLENDNSSDISPKLVDSNEVPPKSITVTPVESKKDDTATVKTIDEKLDSSCIQFSDTEDDSNNEIQNLVRSIVDASSQSDDITESRSASPEKDEDDSEQLFTKMKEIEEKCNSSPIHQNSEHPGNNIGLSQSSQNDSLENSGPIILSYKSYAAKNSKDSLHLEEEMDVDCANDNKEKIVSSSSENKLNTVSNLDCSPEIMSSKQGFHPQMEHSYFNKNLPDEINSDINKTKIRSKVPMIHFSANNERNEEFIKISKVYFENEIKCVMKDLIVLVEKLNYNFKRDDMLQQDYYDIDFSNYDENSAADSNHASDKENHVGLLSEADKLAKGSKKRKNKAPIRSAFTFRRRGKMDGPKQSLTKVEKAVNISESDIVVPHCPDLTITPVFPKSDISNENENSMTKIISSIVDSITETETDADLEILPTASCSSLMSRAQRLELSNDELTDLNTRLNASSAPQTRRSKLIAASQKNIKDIDCSDTFHSDVVIVCSEDSNSNLSSILKKKKVPPVPKHLRRVTFASPLIQELVFESFSETKGIETITMSSLQTLSKKRKKILLEKVKAEKVTPPAPPQPSVESQEVPSSSEYQDSDVVDFCDRPVSPAFINCQDSISVILKDLTSPTWERALESLLLSKNIKTIGDVCKLNIHQLKALPFKSPKVLTLHKALISYLNQTQESMLEKFKTIDDGSSELEATTANASTASTSAGISNTPLNTVNPATNEEMKLLEETVSELLRSGKLKDLRFSLLGELVENCGRAISEKYRNSK